MATACNKCDLLNELYGATIKTPRLYWVMTELFVFLHGGDVCKEPSITVSISASIPESYDLICSIGELIDKLSIENIKCHHANESILAERRKVAPDTAVIAAAEWRARTSGEQRVRLRDEINRRLAEAIERGGIRTAQEVRTYDLRGVGNGS